MPRNTTLAIVVSMLKAEVGANLMVGTASADDNRYAMLIDQKQQWLADSYDWPFQDDDWDVQVPAGSRYLNFPGVDEESNTIAINFERPVETKTWWSAAWLPVDYGIDEDDYNARNSDGAPPDTGAPPDVLDPIQRWSFNGETQFEVWPVTASKQIFRFRGQRQINSLITYTNGTTAPAAVAPSWTGTLCLDDQMVMLFAAAEELELKGKSNAQDVLARAQARIQFIRANYPKRTKTCSFGGARNRQYNKIIPVKKILVA